MHFQNNLLTFDASFNGQAMPPLFTFHPSLFTFQVRFPMKKTFQILGFFSFLSFAFLTACDPKKTGVEPADIAAVVSGLEANQVKLAWTPVPGADHVNITWKSATGKYSGSLVAKDNQALIRPKAPGEVLTFTLTAMKGDSEIGTQTLSLMMANPYSKSYENDTIATDDVIIQFVGRATAVPRDICNQTFDSCTITRYCDGYWFRINRSAAEEYYQVMVEGARADRTTYTVTFIVRIDSTGAASYYTQDQLNCVSLNPKRLCTAGRVSAYDNGDFAFVFYATSITGQRGLMIGDVDNVRSVRVKKAGGCN